MELTEYQRDNELTTREQAKLEQLEGVIYKNCKAFFEVGRALAEIRERRLYRGQCKTFEQYAKRVFDIARKTAYRYITAAEVMDNLCPIGHKNDNENVSHGTQNEILPKNELQARELAVLPKEQQPMVWQMILTEAGDKRITAGMVKNRVRSFMGEETIKKIRKARDKAKKTQELSDEFLNIYTSLLDYISAASSSKYKTSKRRAMLKKLDTARAILAEDGILRGETVFTGASDDAIKLETAGYKLFRMERNSMTIRERAGGGWIKHSGPFERIFTMEAAFLELMKNRKHLRC